MGHAGGRSEDHKANKNAKCVLVPFPRGTRTPIWWRKFQYSITFGLLCIALHQIYMKESRTQRRRCGKSVKLGKERSIGELKDVNDDQYWKRLVQ